MRNLLILFSFLIAFTAISQENYDNVVFKFKSKSEFENQFNKTSEKKYDFTILGLENNEQATKLQQKISKSRGVESFTISEKDETGIRNAKIKLYKYAYNWVFYEFFFKNNGIKTVIIENIKYNTEGLNLSKN